MSVRMSVSWFAHSLSTHPVVWLRQSTASSGLFLKPAEVGVKCIEEVYVVITV